MKQNRLKNNYFFQGLSQCLFLGKIVASGLKSFSCERYPKNNHVLDAPTFHNSRKSVERLEAYFGTVERTVHALEYT